jgi:hypothetical protein
MVVKDIDATDNATDRTRTGRRHEEGGRVTVPESLTEPDEPPEQQPVLTLDGLLADIGTVAEADRALVADVLALVDVIDDETAAESFLLNEWAPAIAAAMRAILGPHRPDHAGRCTTCPTVVWPCSPWRAAYRWIFEFDTDGYRRNIEGYWVVRVRHRRAIWPASLTTNQATDTSRSRSTGSG